MEAWLFFDEFILNSSSSSSSDKEEIVERVKRPRIENYINIVDQYSDFEFRENLWMTRLTFNHILEKIQNKITITQTGRNTISAKIQLLLALWYFATPDSYRSICGRFDVAKSSGLEIVRRVCNAILDLSSTYIRWPQEERLDIVRRGFEEKGFPDTIGSIDGSYIPIPMPKEEGRAYICRKNFPCITLQAVCDHDLLFTHCYAGESGAVHDASVLKRSEIWTYMCNRTEEYFPNNTHLIGDKAYPITPQLITPFKNNANLTPQQIRFNTRLSSARNVIERAFGQLKKRFRILKFMDVRCLDWIPKYIIACCVLHNICILQNDVMEIEDEVGNNADEIEEAVANDNRHLRELRNQGMRKRNGIAANM